MKKIIILLMCFLSIQFCAGEPSSLGFYKCSQFTENYCVCEDTISSRAFSIPCSELTSRYPKRGYDEN
jgi:hypothetical protein